jgi:hypothetical protein
LWLRPITLCLGLRLRAHALDRAEERIRRIACLQKKTYDVIEQRGC